VRDYAPFAKQSGIPEIKTVLGGFVIRHFMGAWTLAIKSIGVCLAVASGLWLGKEGPLVHVACCCANLLMKFSTSLSENEARKREVLSAAAAAGISVAFGAPIGGVMFSLEQLSYYFPDKTMWQSFVCAMVAAFTLQFVDPFRKGDIILFETQYSQNWHDFELLPFALLGIIGGVYGGVFTKLNMAIAKWRQSSRISEYPVLEVFLVSIVTAFANYPNVFMRAESYELTWLLFADCASVKDDILGLCDDGHFVNSTLLLIAALFGAVFTAITFGLRVPAGVILPSMAVGGLYGRMFGVVFQHLQGVFSSAFFFAGCDPDTQCITPGTYALIGAASALAGVTRMTVSIVVIMFELTGALDYVLPIMISVMLAKWVADAFDKKGFYESWINFRGFPLLDNRDDSAVPDMPAAKVMTRVEEIATITATGHSINSLQEFLVAHLYRGFPIVDDHKHNMLLGYISRTELSYALKLARRAPRTLPPETEVFFLHQPHADPITTLDLRPWMDQTPITLNSRCTFQLTVDMFMRLGLKYILFLHHGSLAGLLTKKDIWYILNNRSDYETHEEDDRMALGRRRSGGRSSEGAGLLSRGSGDDGELLSGYENR
jgi:chloride channel 3/4/5